MWPGVAAAMSLALTVTAGTVFLDSVREDHEYRWVDPPPEHAPHNVAPEGRSAEAPPGVETFWTPDLQVQLRWGERRVEAPVKIEVEPIRTTRLSPLPDDAEPAGNAYRVSLDPDRGVSDVVMHLRVPGAIDRVYVSAGTAGDAAWESVPFEPEEPGVVTLGWEGDGAVLAARIDESQPPWPAPTAVVGTVLIVALAATVRRRADGKRRARGA